MNQHVKVRENCVEIGRLAWQVLSGNWIKAVLAGAVLVLACVVVSVATSIVMGIISIPFGKASLIYEIMSVILAIISVIACFPATLGYYSFFLSICRGQENSPLIVVKGFENTGRAIGIGLLTAIFNFIGFLVGWFLQGLYLLVIPYPDRMPNDPSGLLIEIAIFIGYLIILFAAMIFVYILFSVAFYVLANHPGIGCIQAIGVCVNLMWGNVRKKFILYLYLSLIAFAIQAPGLLIMKFFYGSAKYVLFYEPRLGTVYVALFIIINLIQLVMSVALITYAMACETVFYEIASGNLGAAENSWKPVEHQPYGSMPYGNQQYAGEGWGQEESEPVGETMESINFNFNIGDSGGEPLLSEQQKSNTNNTINRDLSESIGPEQKAAQKPAAIMGLGQTAPEREAVEANPVRNLNQAEPVGNLNQTEIPVDEMSSKNMAEKNVSEKKTVMAENVHEDEAVTRTRKIIREMIECGDSSLESFIRRWEEQNSAKFH